MYSSNRKKKKIEFCSSFINFATTDSEREDIDRLVTWREKDRSRWVSPRKKKKNKLPRRTARLSQKSKGTWEIASYRGNSRSMCAQCGCHVTQGPNWTFRNGVISIGKRSTKNSYRTNTQKEKRKRISSSLSRGYLPSVLRRRVSTPNDSRWHQSKKTRKPKKRKSFPIEHKVK